MKHGMYFLRVMLVVIFMSQVKTIKASLGAQFESYQQEQQHQKNLLLHSWNVQNLDYEIHIRAKAYERGLNARWNWMGKQPQGRVLYNHIIREKAFEIFNTGYLTIEDNGKKTIIPYAKYDPFYGTFEKILADGEHNHIHIAGRGSSLISVSFDDYTCTPSPSYRIFRKDIPGRVTNMYYYKTGINPFLRFANWLVKWRSKVDFIKDGLEQSCLATVQSPGKSKEEVPVPLFHSRVLKEMAQKRKTWNTCEMLKLPSPYLWISVKAWLCGFFDLKYTMPDNRTRIDHGIASLSTQGTS